MAVVPTSPGLHPRRRVLAWPSTTLGRRSAVASAFVLVWFVCLGALASVDASDRGWLARGIMVAAGLAGIVVGISSGVAAVVAIVRGDRSLVLAAPLLCGALWVLFLLGELLVPH